MPYLLDFLDSYDFGSGEEYEDHALIGASVLGNVFERLNAYKEGSFYTPSAITNYMCEQSITKVVVDKFNATFAWQCEDLNALRTRIDRDFDTKKQEFKDTLRSIRICDPAVGSGHFLVATLNKMLKIYYDLGLCGSIQREEAHIIGDEFYLSDFTYTKPKSEAQESHKIQRELFVLKKSIIENNLFGVDINPNSVEICKLRLWIELLKSSYYLLQGDEGYDDKLNSHIHQMQTLPNIDINIKCGNSLISNFPLDSKLLKGQTLQFSRNLTQAIQKYKTQVALYKESLGSKDEIEREIKSIKKLLKDYFIKQSQTTKNLEYNLQKFVENYGETFFDCGDDFCMEMSKITKEKQNARGDKGGYAYRQSLTQPTHSNSKTLDKNGEKLLKQLQSDFKSLESLRNNDSFEWRFEFPEVLNENGDFMGFDLIIGNPPYGVDLSPQDRQIYKNIYNFSSADSAQLFILLADKIVNPNGINTFIVPKSLVYVAKWKPLRDILKPNLYVLADCGKAWSYVKLEMVIYAVHKNHKCNSYENTFLTDSTKIKNNKDKIKEEKILYIDKKLIDLFGLFINNLSKKEIDLGIKIRTNCKQMLLDCAECYRGGGFQKNVTKSKIGYKVLGGMEIKRYFIDGIKGYVDKNKIDANATIKDNSILLQRIIAHIDNPISHIKFTGTITDDKTYKIVNTIFQIICKEHISNKFILGLFHSKLINWYAHRFAYSKAIRSMDFSNEVAGKIPIPKITKENQKIVDTIIESVDKILKIKAQDSTTPLCHTEALAEVSQKQKRDLVDSSLSAKAKNDKGKYNRDFSHFANAQNDKIEEVDDKSAKVKNDKIENHNRDISPVAQYDKTNKSQYDTTDLESQIDDLVYQLYELNSHEIQIIESK